MSQTDRQQEHAEIATDEIAHWIQCRKRLQLASRAILQHSSIWPEEMPERVADKAHADRQEHIEAAHKLLWATLGLLAKGEVLDLPYDINPTPDNVAVLSFTLQKDEAYFILLEQAVHIVLDYLEHERKLLQEWSADQAEAPNAQ
ncbi:hypothetical protein OH77DRAFT_1525585 [Trametes cingulata]|nr:hypothetical protein OH77DRAFT_1525585 [Trametes cingulata]